MDYDCQQQAIALFIIWTVVCYIESVAGLFSQEFILFSYLTGIVFGLPFFSWFLEWGISKGE